MLLHVPRIELTRRFFFWLSGNAAIVLRSRLKVRVLKENREKRARVDDLGVILTNGDSESSRKVMQYQVSAENPQPARDVLSHNTLSLSHSGMHAP